ncbi:hypothetical protein E6C50_02105 [Flavobacterium supellecticarium]|uniref:Uncharacterized protein n=1 Tax=Flavobacterium supellecticarium TaxID=2565924 RepID=A0A4S4A3L6_9FLAO|nr:hypothetical protein [Flavobacterium supellecticarium]THF53024.1 hypothetical protein E6C50_02105 [Flavobacterium supellecticarium]
MMSKQINFFHTESDIKEFLDFFRSNVYKLYPHKVDDLNKLREINFPHDRRIIIFRDSKKLEYEYIEKQGYYLLNPENSEAIDFLISAQREDGKSIEAGRLYYTEKIFTSQSLLHKSDDFVKASNRLYTLFKRRFLKKTKFSKGWYLTQSIINSFEQGEAVWERNNNVIRFHSKNSI